LSESRMDCKPRANNGLLRMELSTSCEGCFSCVAACPTGALESSSPGPRFNEAACTGCGLCVEFCLEDAIRIHPKGEAVDGGG
jgi:ferredoxin